MLILHPSSCCDVCLEEYTWDDPAQAPYTIPCGHIFCETCLTAITPPNCPLCRNSFVNSTIKKLHVDHLATSEQQELELLRRLALSWGTPDDEQVDVLEEIDVWLDDRGREGKVLKKAREMAAKCQQLLRSKEHDGRTIRELTSEVRDYQKRMASDKDNALAIEASLLEKAKTIEENLRRREVEMEHLRAENSGRVAQYEAEMRGLRTESSRRVTQFRAGMEALRTKSNRRVAQYEAELEGLQTENTRRVVQYEAEMESLRAENNRRVAQCEAKTEELQNENERKEALHEAKVEYLEAKVEYLQSSTKVEVQVLKAKAELLAAETNRQISCYKSEIECRKADVEYLKANVDSHLSQKTAEVECLRGEITGSNDPVQSLMENLWTDEWSASPLASFRDFIVPSYREIEARTRCLNDENRSLSRELEAVKSLLEKPQTLSEVRDREPKDARVFVPKTDALSTADVIRQVTDLNCQIRGMATHFGKLLQNVKNPVTAQEPATGTLEDANWMLGKQLASFLSANLLVRRAAGCTEPDPLLADVVLQIAVTRWCRFMTSSWKPSDHSVADFMKTLYSGICQFEDPAICGRWRSITWAQLRRSSSDDLRWSEGLMQGLDSVLDVAGWSIQDSDRRQLEMRLPLLFEAVKILRKAIGEDITSIDLEVATIEAGTIFDTDFMKPHWMSSLFLEGRKEGTLEEVIGTTGLGLWARKGHMLHLEMALLPQVVLRGAEELIKPFLL